MNKHIKRFLHIILFSLLALPLFVSCGNLFSNVEDAESRATYSTVHFVANMQAKGEVAIEARSAIPLLELNEAESVHYFVKATAQGKSDRLVHGMSPSLGIDLDSDTHWKIVCGIGKITTTVNEETGATIEEIKDENIYMSSPQNPEPEYISPLSPVLSKNFVLLPASGGSGYLELTINIAADSGIDISLVNCDNIINIECSEIANLSDKTELTCDTVHSDTEHIEVIYSTKTNQSIPSGQYQFTIKFKNSSGVVLYETLQTVNIINKMTTKKWVSDGQVINETGVFTVTKALVDNFLDSTLYVGVIPPLSEMTEVKADDTNSGSAYSPLKTLGAAIKKIETGGSSSKDYHIYVSGEIEVNVWISSDLNTKAASITIEGYTAPDSSGKPTAKLLGLPVSTLSENAALKIESNIPLTVKNLWIKPKEASPVGKYTRGIYVGSSNSLTVDGVLISGFNSLGMNGAGICINNTNAQLKAVNSNITENISDGDGGGIYIYGNCTKNHIIENCKISENHASYGGGLSVEGAKLKIYRSSITNNYADRKNIWDGGGGICLNVNEDYDEADVTLGSGCIIRENKAKTGGGILNSGGKLTIDGAQIINNHAVNEQPEDSSIDEGWGGGIYISEYGSLDIISGIISGNTAQKIGGGIYVGEFQQESYVNITGGRIENNSALTRSNSRGKGGAIYLSGEIVDDEPFYFYLGGSVSIPAGTSKTNDIYLGKASFQSCISLVSSLINHSASSPIVLALDGESTPRGEALVKASGIESLENYKKSFIIDDSEYNLNLSSDKKELRVDFPIYVKQGGTAAPEEATGRYDKPFASISDACSLIINSEVDYTIKIIGTLNGAQEIPATAQAVSITLQGANGVYPSGHANAGRPKDDINGGYSNAPVLTIKSTADVTIKELKLWCALNTSGSGGSIYSATANTVTLSSGSSLEGSVVSKNNCGGAGVYKENGKLIIEEGSKIFGPSLTPSAGDKCFGAGLYLKKADFVMTGGIIQTANSKDGDYCEKGGGIYFDPDGTNVSAKISGGEISTCKAEKGAGIYMNGGNLYMSGGAIWGNMGDGSSSCGSGIYVDGGANIYLYGKALIGKANISTAPTANTSTMSNYATQGGGIYINKGKVWLGYKDTDKPQKFEEVAEGVLGGIIGNYATENGGGIYINGTNDNNNVYMADGQIAYNGAKVASGLGGGIFISQTNKAEYVFMTGGSFKGNSAKQGGAIYNNTASGALNIGGDAYIEAMDGEGKNDIYLVCNNEKPIYVTSELSKHNSSKKINVRVDESNFSLGNSLVVADFAMSDELLKAFNFIFTDEDMEALAAENKKRLFMNMPIFVAGEGYDSNLTGAGSNSGDGSRTQPYNTLSRAFTRLRNSEQFFNIRINGTLRGSVLVPDTIEAQSILLEGIHTTYNEDGSPKDSLIGNNPQPVTNGTTLKINKATKVTIKNLNITEGKCTGKGGGIYVCSDATLVLDQGAWIVGNTASYNASTGSGGGIYNEGTLIMKGGLVNNNTATAYGGGIYSTGNVYIYGDAVIGNENKKDTFAEGSDFGNRADNSGGGIYCGDNSGNNNRKIYLGYDENGEKAEWTGGVYHNLALNSADDFIGGGIYIHNFELKMDSGTISGNKGQGLLYNGKNYAYSEISGGLITKNKKNNSDNNGAGICLMGGDLEISGGKIKDNFKTSEGNGSDIFIQKELLRYTDKGFAISGSACLGTVYIDKLHSNMYTQIIRVTGPLEPPADAGGISATIQIYEDASRINLGFMHGDGLLKGFDGYKITSQDAEKIRLSDETWEILKDFYDPNLFNVDKPIYIAGEGHSSVTGNGSDQTGNGSKTNPFATIKEATRAMTTPSSPYTVFIDGTLKGPQEIPVYVDSIDGTYKPGTIKLIGLNGLNSQGIPKDSIDAGGEDNCGTALTVNGNFGLLTITNLKITGGNTSTPNCGGGIYIKGKESTDSTILQLEDGVLITRNTASGENSAGGIYTNGDDFYFYGGEVSGNSGSHAVFANKMMYVKGSAYVPNEGPGYDVHINTIDNVNGNVRVYSHLKKHTTTDKMWLTFDNRNYNVDTKIFGSTNYINSECGKFTIDDGTYLISGSGYIVTSYLGSKIPGSTLQVGDVILKDGSAVPYTELTETQKNAAVGVFFYSGTDCSNDGSTRNLCVSLAQQTNCAWCTNSTNASVSINSIICTPDQETAGLATTFENALDRNGSDNTNQIAKRFGNISLSLDPYPAFDYVNRYRPQSISSSYGFYYNWYLPSAAELFQIYKNKTTINAAIAACGGTELSGAYLTSSQDANTANMVTYLDFDQSTNIFSSVLKSDYTKKVRAIHEF